MSDSLPPPERVEIIIPARGRSSRLHKKNIQPLCGKPLLVHAIETAGRWKRSTDIYVNSEDEEILAMAQRHGAEAHRRPDVLSGDDVLAIDVIKEHIRTRALPPERVVVLLQVTCPLRTAEDLENGFRLFETHRRRIGVVCVSEYEKPPELAFSLDGSQRLRRRFPEDFHLLTQRHAPAYRFNTGFVINTAGGFLAQQDTVGKTPLGYVLPPERSIDIDYPYQLRLAELILRERQLHDE